MPFNPLIILIALLAVAGLCSLPAVGGPMGVGVDHSMQNALVHAELAACVLLLFPAVAPRRGAAIRNLLVVVACFAAASACVMLFHFAARGNLPLESRSGALGAWMFAGGLLAVGARLGRPWALRARVLLLCVFALPALAHYFALEYGGGSLLHLRPISPAWALAAGELDRSICLLFAAVPLWATALALPSPKAAP